MMQKSMYFHYDFACKKVPLSLRYAKQKLSKLERLLSTVHPHMIHVITKRSHTFPTNITHMRLCLWTCRLYPLLVF
jgi:hypothetical protein